MILLEFKDDNAEVLKEGEFEFGYASRVDKVSLDFEFD